MFKEVYTYIVQMYITDERRRVRSHKVFLFRNTSRVDKTMLICLNVKFSAIINVKDTKFGMKVSVVCT